MILKLQFWLCEYEKTDIIKEYNVTSDGISVDVTVKGDFQSSCHFHLHFWDTVGKTIIWSPADFVRLPTDKEMISL